MSDKKESGVGKKQQEILETDKLITSYLSFRGLQKQHIDSYNHFILIKMKQIVDSVHNRRVTTDADPDFLLEYLNIYVDVPTFEEKQDRDEKKNYLFPAECRTSDLTYASDIYVDVAIYFAGKDPIIEKGIKIGRLPIMIGCCRCNLNGKTESEIYRANECIYDPKGYFIIRGVEKVLLIQEQMVDNRIIVDYNNKTNLLETIVNSYHIETKSRASIHMRGFKYYVKTSSFKDVPLFIFFKALGIESEQEIIQLIGTEDYITDSLIQSLEDIEEQQIYNQTDALKYLGSKINTISGRAPSTAKKSLEDQARSKLQVVFLAHVNCKKYDFYPRAVYLGLMVRRLIQATKDNSLIDNRDYYGNKRMKCAGQLMEYLFEDKFKNFNAEISKYLKKELGRTQKQRNMVQDIVNYMKNNSDIITNGIFDTVASGNWKIKRFSMDRKSVSQLLARISFISVMGMLTKMSSQFEKTRKISGPRALLGSHWGMICPSDTPDGESCGLVKTLALLTHITNDLPEEPILHLIINLGVEDLAHFSTEDYYAENNYLIFLNGNIVGLHNNPEKLARQLRFLRRHGKINEFVSVFVDTKRRSLFVSSDGGRLLRPLIIVTNQIPQLQPKHVENLKQNNAEMEFSNFVKQGLIEYLDVNEQDNALIALTPAYINKNTTHLEIDQMTILSCVTSIIPFPHHNQSPRNTYQCQMGKQSIGVIGTNQFTRCDTILYLLIYPQAPLVRTVAMEAINYHKLPAGHNAQVAVMSYSCYDIEDALIVNKSSLDRGFGRTAIYRRQTTECTIHTPDEKYQDRIVAPQIDTQQKGSKRRIDKRSHALDQDGLAKVGAKVYKNKISKKLNNGDIYVNKITPLVPSSAFRSLKFQSKDGPQDNEVGWKDSPSVLKSHWSQIVDRVITTKNEKGTRIVKTILRYMRRPELGDKFSSRHGQKGVIGLIVNQEDMPFSETGWCPDLIMNPHGYPSRMTVGKLIELLCGKLGALEGKFKYGTAFGGEKVDQVSEELIKRGYHFQGKDCLISGITGEYCECYVFQGPIYYQRLKHMVEDKVHARGRGPIQTLTRQPVEGRARDGGQRVGEMERDCLCAYGASSLLLERLLISSDLFHVYVCQFCGLFKNGEYCESCATDKVFKVRMPYACKLLFQELLAMNIKPTLNLVPIHERQEFTVN